MNFSRNTWIALSGLIVLAIVAFLTEKGGQPTEHPRVGKPLVSIEDLNKISEISLKDGDQQLLLKRSKDSLWLVDQEGEFPAEASKVVRLIDQLTASEIRRLVSTHKEKWSTLDIQTEKYLAIKEGDNNVLMIHPGKIAQSGGQFVGFADGPESFVIDPALNLDLKADNWVLKTIVDLNKSDIKELSVKRGEEQWTLIHDGEKGLFLLRDKPEQKTENQAAIDKLLTSFANLNYSQREKLPASESNLSPDLEIDLSTESGDQYHFKIITVQSAAAAKENEAQKQYKVQLSLTTSSNEALKTMINQHLSHWLFLVDAYKLDPLMVKASELWQDKKVDGNKDG